MRKEDLIDEFGQPTELAWRYGVKFAIVLAILSWTRFILVEAGVF